MRRCGWLVVVATAGAALAAPHAARAQRARPVGRLVVGALNPDTPSKATMAFGVEAGVGLGARAALLGRVLRQSQNRNSGADLSREARDLFSVLIEQGLGHEANLRRQYVLRIGGGVMVRRHLPSAAVATLGLGVRYPLRRAVTLVGAFEDDVAALPEGSYSYSYWDPAQLTTVWTTVIAKEKIQHNFGFLLAVEWRP